MGPVRNLWVPSRRVCDHPRCHAPEHEGRPRCFQRHGDNRKASQERSSGCKHVSPPLRAFKYVADRLRVPLAPARRRDTTSVQRVRNVSQGACASLLCLSNDGQDVGSEPVSPGRHSVHRVPAGHVELGATQGDATGLCCRKCLPCSHGNQTHALSRQVRRTGEARRGPHRGQAQRLGRVPCEP